MTDDERALAHQLHRLTDLMDSPEVSVTDDLARGRTRRTRRRLAVGGAALATLAVLGVGAAVVPGLGDGRDAAPAGGDVTTPTGPETTPPVRPDETEVPRPDRPSPGADDPDDGFFSPDDFPEPPPARPGFFVDLRRAVASHLDPGGTHISEREIRAAGLSGEWSGDTWSAVTQRIGWENPGESGLGVVQVGVATSFAFDCGGHGPGGPSGTCTETDLAGTPVTRIDDPELGTTWAYRRADGYVTTITLDELYGNNSLTPVSDIGVTPAQLAAALTDPALDVPGHPDPVTVDVLAGTELRDVARDVLGPGRVTGESWAGQLGGYWSGDVGGVGVSLDDEQDTIDMDAPCQRWYAVRCVTRETAAGPVRIDYRTTRGGGGFDVTLDGAVRMIGVRVQDLGVVPVDLAVALATDPRLQRP